MRQIRFIRRFVSRLKFIGHGFSVVNVQMRSGHRGIEPGRSAAAVLAAGAASAAGAGGVAGGAGVGIGWITDREALLGDFTWVGAAIRQIANLFAEPTWLWTL